MQGKSVKKTKPKAAAKAKPGDKRLGNKFWQIRTKHGRDRLFASPELLMGAAVEYFQWCDDNPFKETVVQKIKINRDKEIIKLVEVPKMRPYTMQGLCSFLNCNTVYFNQFEYALKEKKELTPTDEGFSKAITCIRETIYNQKFSGAAAGFLNANIIARDLGLVDKKQQEHSGEIKGFDLSGAINNFMKDADAGNT